MNALRSVDRFSEALRELRCGRNQFLIDAERIEIQRDERGLLQATDGHVYIKQDLSFILQGIEQGWRPGELENYLDELQAKVQFLINSMQAEGRLEEGAFTFPDGDTWHAESRR